MNIDALINDPSLVQTLQTLKNRIYSDIIDDEGLQYIDLVMEGGGMLGIALVGYTWALEQAGLRFLGIGGTSAGSINALLLAALGNPAQPKSPKLLKELSKKNFYDFVDGDSDAKDLIKSWVEGAGKVKLAFKAVQVIDNLNENLGLNPGKAFEDWLKKLLADEGIRTWADLRARLETLPVGLRTRSGEKLDTPAVARCRLAIVAADVSTETKVIFPDNANLYFKNPDAQNPALFARASMSIPFFFEPYRVRSLPRDAEAKQRWDKVGFDIDKEGGVPKDAMFVDGGIMSNFPIDLFHNYSRVPVAPTFGVKLQYDDRRRQIDSPLGLLGAIFNSARHCLDYDFIRRNPDYNHLVCWIPCQGYNWLDFDMSEDHKRGLFREGAEQAIQFLTKFNWEEYKKLRKTMVEIGEIGRGN